MSEPIRIPGLASPEKGADLVSRRESFFGREPGEQAAMLTSLAVELRVAEGSLRRLADAVRAPYAEVVASPFAIRAIALAAEQGAYLVHHDTRAALAWPEASLGGDAVADEMHGVWHRGVLHSGKYQSFLQDEPLCTFNPNHMAKWTPHELLHRVCGFVWREGIHPWELYLSARMNELLPVVLWYGLDEVARQDGDGFNRARSAAHPHITLEESKWLRLDETSLEALVARSLPNLDKGASHLRSELDAIDTEICTGRPVVVPHDFLNASSDAVAYVVGHLARLNDRATTRLYERALFAGLGVEDSVISYRARIEEMLDRLLFGEIHLHPVQMANRQAVRRHWDWLQRAAQLGWGSFRKLVPLLEEWRTAAMAAWDAHDPVEMSAWDSRIADTLEEDIRSAVLATGEGTTERERHQLLEGLESIVPATVVALERSDESPDWLEAFIASPSFTSRAPLVERIAVWLEATSRPALAELARFERDIVSVEDEDPVFETIAPGALIDDRPGLLCANSAFETYTYGWQVTALHAEPASEPNAVPETLLLGGFEGGVSVLPCPAAVEALWARLVQGPASLDELRAAFESAEPPSAEFPPTADLWIDELIEAGAIGWVPRLD